jgi:hypothetical protein
MTETVQSAQIGSLAEKLSPPPIPYNRFDHFFPPCMIGRARRTGTRWLQQLRSKTSGRRIFYKLAFL